MERTVFTIEFLNKLVNKENSCVEMVTHKRGMTIEPHYGLHVSKPIKEKLDSVIAKYDSQLKGLVLAYKNVKILSNVGMIDNLGYSNFPIRVDFYVFKPVPGKTLKGVVYEKNQELVGCLVYKTFTVSLLNLEEGNKWAGNNVEIGQTITFRITSVTLTSKIPYIQGEFLEKRPGVKRKIRYSDIMETEENCSGNVNKSEPVEKKKKSEKKSKKEKNIIEKSI